MSTYLFQETPERAPWSGPEPQPGEGKPAHEPMFNVPWTTLALSLVILGGYAVQSRLPDFTLQPYVFSPAALMQGAWWTLVTHMFLHGGWLHALSNAAFVLAFGSPVARYFGTRGWGVPLYFIFYVLCGVLAALGFASVHLGSQQAMIGASGAASGLVGAAARLVAGRGRLGPIFAPFVLTMGASWLFVNLLVAGVMAAGATGLIPGTGGAGVAWEAHLAGFLAGVLLVSPFAWLLRRLRPE
ncbi:MAG: rhomboid family intramembrane serine protease [Phenylobacterium sp.]|nr:MAG: rhomboid family intramembrane serine protease [Phenylobacterium sp.]